MKTKVLSVITALVVLSAAASLKAEEKTCKAMIKCKQANTGEPNMPLCCRKMAAICCCKTMAEQMKCMGMPQEMVDRCAMMMNVPVSMGDPRTILSKTDDLKLSAEQTDKINAIIEKACQDAMTVLDAQQQQTVKAMDPKPVSMADLHATMMERMKEKGCPMMQAEKTKSPSETQAEVKQAEQTVCPVMGEPISKQYFTMYKDKKVYFCCPKCKPKFENDPEKYISKLPQFNEKASEKTEVKQ